MEKEILKQAAVLMNETPVKSVRGTTKNVRISIMADYRPVSVRINGKGLRRCPNFVIHYRCGELTGYPGGGI
jgi:hypothetical protein